MGVTLSPPSDAHPRPCVSAEAVPLATGEALPSLGADHLCGPVLAHTVGPSGRVGPAARPAQTEAGERAAGHALETAGQCGLLRMGRAQPVRPSLTDHLPPLHSPGPETSGCCFQTFSRLPTLLSTQPSFDITVHAVLQLGESPALGSWGPAVWGPAQHHLGGRGLGLANPPANGRRARCQAGHKGSEEATPTPSAVGSCAARAVGIAGITTKKQVLSSPRAYSTRISGGSAMTT